MPALIENRIHPDFIVIADSGLYNLKYLYDFLNRKELNNTKYICPLTINPILFRLISDKAIIYDDTHPFHFLSKINAVSLSTGGSVILSALEFAKRINKQKIFLLGLNLSYYKNLYHYIGNIQENDRYYKSNKFYSFYHQLTEIHNNHGHIKSNDADNNSIFTNQSMISYANYLSQWMQNQNRNTNIYNLTENSIKIDGFIINKKAKSILNMKDKDQSIDKDNIIVSKKIDIDLYLKSIKSFIETVKTIIKNLTDNNNIEDILLDIKSSNYRYYEILRFYLEKEIIKMQKSDNICIISELKKLLIILS